jgi:hypothetical protein
VRHALCRQHDGWCQGEESAAREAQDAKYRPPPRGWPFAARRLRTLHDRLPIAKIVNGTVITLDDAPDSYQLFDKGAAKKFVIDANGAVKAAA